MRQIQGQEVAKRQTVMRTAAVQCRPKLPKEKDKSCNMENTLSCSRVIISTFTDSNLISSQLFFLQAFILSFQIKLAENTLTVCKRSRRRSKISMLSVFLPLLFSWALLCVMATFLPKILILVNKL